MRVVKVEIAPEVVALALTQGYEPKNLLCVEGLPSDSVLTNAFIAPSGNLALVFHHEALKEVPEGGLPPLLAVIYRSPFNPWGGEANVEQG